MISATSALPITVSDERSTTNAGDVSRQSCRKTSPLTCSRSVQRDVPTSGRNQTTDNPRSVSMRYGASRVKAAMDMGHLPWYCPESEERSFDIQHYGRLTPHTSDTIHRTVRRGVPYR